MGWLSIRYRIFTIDKSETGPVVRGLLGRGAGVVRAGSRGVLRAGIQSGSAIIIFSRFLQDASPVIIG